MKKKMGKMVYFKRFQWDLAPKDTSNSESDTWYLYYGWIENTKMDRRLNFQQIEKFDYKTEDEIEQTQQLHFDWI